MKKLLILLSIVLLTFSCFSQQPIDLTNWKFQTGDNPEWMQPEYNDGQWYTVKSGVAWESFGLDDDYGWYRVRFWLPSDLKRKMIADSLCFYLRKICEADQTFLNGKLIGQNGQAFFSNLNSLPVLPKEDQTNIIRDYVLSVNDSRLLWDGENVLAIRVRGSSKWSYSGLVSRNNQHG